MNDTVEQSQISYDYFIQQQYFGRNHQIGSVQNSKVKSLEDIIDGNFDIPSGASSTAFIYNRIEAINNDDKLSEERTRVRTGEFFRDGELLTKKQAEKIFKEDLPKMKEDDFIIRIGQTLFLEFKKDAVIVVEENGKMRIKARHPAATDTPEYLTKFSCSNF